VELIDQVAALQAWADEARAGGLRIGLVPTMGALHAGHRALIDEARRRADRVVVSIFVNPAQFDEHADLAAYPRSLEADLAMCREAGVACVFAPAELYARDHETWVELEQIARPLCGASRPGHFRGVATVVTKLLLAAKPHLAFFGEKDFQQLALIRRLVRDLGFGVEIVGVPTVREPDGLALSSRNVHLAGEARRQATALVRALAAAEAAVRAGERRPEALVRVAREELGKAPLARIDYVELRDPQSLRSVEAPLRDPTLLALAVFFPRASADGEEVRLIDNRVLPPPPREEAT